MSRMLVYIAYISCHIKSRVFRSFTFAYKKLPRVEFEDIYICVKQISSLFSVLLLGPTELFKKKNWFHLDLLFRSFTSV